MSSQDHVSSMRVLHVDDDPMFLEVTEEFLGTELPAAEVVTATSVGDALGRLADERFDCVVSDYDMPDTDGLAFLETIRSESPDLPFVLYTGKGSEEIAGRAINRGVTCYLQKGGPDQHRRLANRVEHAVEEYRAKRESERYSTVLRALGYPIYVVDEDGLFEYVNESFVDLVGYDRETLVGSEPSLIKSDDSVERVNEALRSIVSDDGPNAERMEVEIRTNDGERIPCVDHIAALPFEDEFRGCAGILRNVSEQRRREQELVRQNERLEEFVSVVSHDLRTPLRTAETAAELARTGDEGAFETLATAHHRMDRMLDELLTLAREGETVAQTDAVAVAAVAEAAWESVETEAATLTVDTDAVVEADPDRLRRLFENVFGNAVTHAGPSVAVTVETVATDQGVSLAVVDDGPGIPPEQRTDVFEPGFTTAADGTGFGLAIVNRIADAHGWEIHLTDSDRGGARFEFAGLDVADPAEAASEATAD